MNSDSDTVQNCSRCSARRRTWRRVVKFTVGLLIFALFGFAVIPLVRGTGRPAYRSEAEAAAGILKTELRTKYVETKKVPQRNEVWVLNRLEGFENSTISHAKYRSLDDSRGEISVYLWKQRKGWLTYEFSYEDGTGIFEWHDYHFE